MGVSSSNPHIDEPKTTKIFIRGKVFRKAHLYRVLITAINPNFKPIAAF
jgi:hypothetical protein